MSKKLDIKNIKMCNSLDIFPIREKYINENGEERTKVNFGCLSPHPLTWKDHVNLYEELSSYMAENTIKTDFLYTLNCMNLLNGLVTTCEYRGWNLQPKEREELLKA